MPFPHHVTQAFKTLLEGNIGLKNILVLVVLAGLAWFGYGKYQAAHSAAASSEVLAPRVAGSALQLVSDSEGASPNFNCDGRTRCRQMTSCAEATYFIQHCPNTKMDGDHDGVPCERQWCD
jgi:predicted negative regulator of RcsB-dependent stress response